MGVQDEVAVEGDEQMLAARADVGHLATGEALGPAQRPVARLRRRDAIGAEQMSLYAGHVIVSCSTPSGPVELAMSEASLTGFQSWLEAGPPGTDWDRHRT